MTHSDINRLFDSHSYRLEYSLVHKAYVVVWSDPFVAVHLATDLGIDCITVAMPNDSNYLDQLALAQEQAIYGAAVVACGGHGGA